MIRIIDTFLWLIMGIFAMPSVLILFSWTAMPGEISYEIKIGLEQILLNLI